MAGVFKTVTFMVLVFAAVVVFAEDYDVGDDTEWTRPMDPEFYTTWATGKTFRVGDELEFDFAAGRHDVAVVTQDAFENCEKEKPISHMTVPPVKIMLNTTGPQYFICTVGLGAGASGGATPGAGGGATPAPGSTPSAGGTTPPTAGGTTTPSGSSGTTTPAGNAASSLGGATFLVAFVSAVVALF
ncbi:Phytocyanin domain [Arabidopsis suecica]|uniref:Phytocyanin domain n=1 Tax=Arabidopsis suecica TaxID=45249 RepID=A0A8T1ZCY6_ARASU|nr:Phytocyanin domain [Arabidopsis suecica]